MKIYSWNVNGIRSALKKGFLDWFQRTDPDVLCLQEIRSEWEEVPKDVQRILSDGRDVCWFPSRVKKGYAGTAVLSKSRFGFEHRPGLGVPDFDGEGRAIVSDGAGLRLLSGYFPNASEGLVRLPVKRAFSAEVRRLAEAWTAEGRPMVAVGDLNVAPEEIDLANPKPNRGKPGFTDEEREDFRGYLAGGLRDILRDRNPNVPGLYTWWSFRSRARERNVGWRLDIFLANALAAEKTGEVAIHSDVQGSDHCPISLEWPGA